MKKTTRLGLIAIITTILVLLAVVIGWFWSQRSKPVANPTSSSAPVADFSSVYSTSSSSQSSFKPKVTELKIHSLSKRDVISLPVIMYHHILDWNGAAGDAIEQGLRVAPDIFEKHLQYLSQNGYTAVTTKTLYEFATDQGVLPKKPILLSFDDGYTDNYTKAFPLLQKYKMVGDFAIITGMVGTQGFGTWENWKEMLQAGNYFSSHTVNHCYLAPRIKPGVHGPTPQNDTYKPCGAQNSGATLTSGQVRYELKESKMELEKQLSTPILSLVYPYGNNNETVVKIAEELGYKLAFTVAGQSNEKLDLSRPLLIPRYRAFGQNTGTTKLQGFFAGGR